MDEGCRRHACTQTTEPHVELWRLVMLHGNLQGTLLYGTRTKCELTIAGEDRLIVGSTQYFHGDPMSGSVDYLLW